MCREVVVRRWVSFVSLSILLLIAGCGADAELDVVKPEPNLPKVSGIVSLPGGELARAARWWQRLAAAVTSRAHALSGNASPVGAGVAVQLVQLENADAVGPYAPQVIAEGTTNSNGAYQIKLPEGLDAKTCGLVVQVGSEEEGTLTRAFVYSTSHPIDIDFRSEAAVRLVLAEVPPADLCEFDTGEIRAIYDSVDAVPGEVSGGTAEELNAAATAAAANDPTVQGTIAAAVVPATPTETPTERARRTATATATRTATATATHTAGSTRTATATRASATSTRTVSPTSTRTATVTQTPTGTTMGTRPATPNTPTRTVTRTMTRPPTPTATSGRLLGSRIFSIADKPKSALFSSAAGGADISQGGFSSGPIKLEGGEKNNSGFATVTLREDVIFGLLLGTRPAGVTLGTRPALCVKLLAAGSGGSIACNGGAAHDVSLTVDSKLANSASPPTLGTRGGINGGAGAASLTVMTSIVRADVTSAADCRGLSFPAAHAAAYTTTRATTTINNACKNSSCTTTGAINLIKTGVNFNCAQWSTENSVGTLVSPLVRVDVAGSPDEAMILQLAD